MSVKKWPRQWVQGGHDNYKNNKRSKKRQSDNNATGSKSAKHADAPDEAAHKKHKSKASSSKCAKWCAAYHKTSDHDFLECKVILGQAQKMRDAWENRLPAKNHQVQHQKKEKKINCALMRDVGAM